MEVEGRREGGKKGRKGGRKEGRVYTHSAPFLKGLLPGLVCVACCYVGEALQLS